MSRTSFQGSSRDQASSSREAGSPIPARAHPKPRNPQSRVEIHSSRVCGRHGSACSVTAGLHGIEQCDGARCEPAADSRRDHGCSHSRRADGRAISGRCWEGILKWQHRGASLAVSHSTLLWPLGARLQRAGHADGSQHSGFLRATKPGARCPVADASMNAAPASCSRSPVAIRPYLSCGFHPHVASAFS